MIIEKYKELLQDELYMCQRYLKNGNWTKDSDWYAIQRALGAGDLAQMLGASYEEVDYLFEDFKTKIERLYKEYEMFGM